MMTASTRLYIVLCAAFSLVSARSHATHSNSARENNGLAVTPPMGWNSYNHYNCFPNETIAHSNAQALIDLGLASRGYQFVTIDCGWTLPNRTANGTLTWNTARFPSGYPALGDFVHGLGLKFGVYSDGGTQDCMTGDPVQAGSLGHEVTDADTFASWGIDLLKYDNCFSDANAGYPDTSYAPSMSPEPHYKTMSDAISSTNRPIVFQICDWGIDFPSAWAPSLGNTWRITNDIIPAWRTIARIINQAVPQTFSAGPHQWLDLDMLEVGNNIFTTPEEQTHFTAWAIIKSPLMIGAALKDTYTSISEVSLSILSNRDVISYNQDALGKAASFTRRWTDDGYELWSGPLSGGRTVVALINWENKARRLTLSLPDVGLQKAGTIKDIWNGVNASDVLTSYTGKVDAHGTLLLELQDTTAMGQYSIDDATISGNVATFTDIYGSTTSSNYTLLVTYSKALTAATTAKVNGMTYQLAADSSSLSTMISLTPKNRNSLNIESNPLPQSITVTGPPTTFYPSTIFATTGNSSHTTCSTNLCEPAGSKISNLSPSGSATLGLTSPQTAVAGSKFIEVYFCNNDIALSTSWGTGTNTRNMTISVNGHLTRIEVPLSGRSSELYSVAKGWEDTGVFGVLTDGWENGANEVVVGNSKGKEGLVTYGADFVGMAVQW